MPNSHPAAFTTEFANNNRSIFIDYRDFRFVAIVLCEQPIEKIAGSTSLKHLSQIEDAVARPHIRSIRTTCQTLASSLVFVVVSLLLHKAMNLFQKYRFSYQWVSLLGYRHFGCTFCSFKGPTRIVLISFSNSLLSRHRQAHAVYMKRPLDSLGKTPQSLFRFNLFASLAVPPPG